MPSRNYADSHPVLRVSSKRFAASPFLDRYATAETVFGVYGGRLYPLSLGGDPVEGYWRLRRRAALFDVPERPVEVGGPDAEQLLDLVLTRDVRRVAPGRAAYALACDERGGILVDGVLIRFAADRFWYVLADGDFLGRLQTHALGRDVTVQDAGSWVVQVQGPASLDVLAAACDGGAPDPFPYFATRAARIAGQDVVLSRTGWSGELGFEAYTLPGTDGAAVWDSLLAAGEPHGLAVEGLDSLGIRRIEAGILDNGTDIDPTLTPFEAGLGRFVDLDKGPFVGGEALAAGPRHRLLYGISSATAVPIAGACVRQGDRVVGRVTTGAWSPFLERGIGYVRMVAAGDWVGVDVSLGDEEAGAEVVELPFYDPEKRIPRGR